MLPSRSALLILAGMLLAQGVPAQSLPAEGVPAKGLALRDRVPNPLLHIGLEAADGEVGLGESWISDLERLGLDLSGGQGSDGSGQALRLLQRLLAGGATGLAWEEIELALTGLLPRRDAPDLPLLVFRARLAPDAAEKLRGALAGGQLASRARTVGDRDVFALPTESSGAGRAPGSVVELALCGVDLIASNHGMAMDEVLTGDGAEGLSAQPVYRSLSSKLESAPGTLTLYADVARLRYRIAPPRLGETDWLLRWSGLASTRGLMVAVRRAEVGTRLSVLLGTGDQRDGWLDLVERTPAQDLVQRIPTGDLGGVALALEPAKLLAVGPAPRRGMGAPHGRGPGMRGPGMGTAGMGGGAAGAHGASFGLGALRRTIGGGCSTYGLDLERQVLSRLGRACTVQLLRVDDGDPAAVQAVLSVQPKGRGAARQLFDDCASSMGPSAAVTAHPGARGAGELVVRTERERLHFGVIEDAFSLSLHDGALERTRESVAASHRERPRVRREVFASLKKLGVSKRQEVDGVFRIDLSSLLPESSPAGSSLLLRQHVGYFEIEPGVLRVEVLGEN